MFESSVNPRGSKTDGGANYNDAMFESSVNPRGSKTGESPAYSYSEIEQRIRGHRMELKTRLETKELYLQFRNEDEKTGQ